MAAAETAVYRFERAGFCPGCGHDTVFTANGPYFRNTLRCRLCDSAPRNRAIMEALSRHYPQWRSLSIHECSPGWDIVSQRLARECERYVASQFEPDRQPGSVVEGVRLPCRRYVVEDLENQTFKDGQFDLVITQDVFEHVFRPDLAIREIARTLRPGGATLMTVPIVMRDKPSRRRARLDGGRIVHVLEPQFHGNPVSAKGSLVTLDWGYDISAYLQHHSGLSFLMLKIEDMSKGIAGDLDEVLIGVKRPLADL
jgi:SAM-dependent methyltransferase